jgi:hypothetical protein
MSTEDAFPMPNNEALAWLDARWSPGEMLPIETLRRDAPECVQVWLRARDRWLDARAKAPLDFSPSSDEFRMFGGEWIRGTETVRGERGYTLIVQAATDAHRRLSHDDFRSWAGRVYEARKASRAAERRLAEELVR